MRFNIITIFPEIISDYCKQSILGRAQKNDLIKINPVNLRDFTMDNHKTVDDTPYGGGAGMVMKPEPIYKALKSLKAIPFSKADGLTKIKTIFSKDIKRKKRTILLSPRGKQFGQAMAEKLSKLDEVTFVCGRYEGIDQRVTDYMVDEEVSVGPYILAGGELGSLIITEAVSRLLPGVLGNEKSLEEETFVNCESRIKNCEGDVSSGSKFITHNSSREYNQYTKPANFKGWKVPEVLLSGDHKKIEEWRKNDIQS